MPFEAFNPPQFPTPIAPYSAGSKAGNTVYVSGVLALGEGGVPLHVGDAAAQTRHVLETIKTTLAAAGATLADVAMNHIFLKDYADYAAFNAVYAEYFPGQKPARFCVKSELVKADCLIEIASIATLAEIDGLYYELQGRSDGPPLILSAGLGGSATYWAPSLAALGERHRLILYDHRGTGRSDPTLPETVTVASFANDIVALMDGLGLASASLLGHAAGGVAGLALALKAPERLDKLIVVNGWASPDPHFVRCFDTRLALLRDSGVRAYLRAQPIFLYPAEWISENDARLDADEDAQFGHFPAVANVEARIAALRAFDIDLALGEIGVPTLVIGAEDDMLVPIACSHRLAEAIPGARLATLAWGGHGCNVTDPDGFAAPVLDFLGS